MPQRTQINCRISPETYEKLLALANGYKHREWILSNTNCLVTILNSNGDLQSVYIDNFHQYFTTLGLGTFDVHSPTNKDEKNKGLTSVIFKLRASDRANSCKLSIGSNTISTTTTIKCPLALPEQ